MQPASLRVNIYLVLNTTCKQMIANTALLVGRHMQGYFLFSHTQSISSETSPALHFYDMTGKDRLPSCVILPFRGFSQLPAASSTYSADTPCRRYHLRCVQTACAQSR